MPETAADSWLAKANFTVKLCSAWELETTAEGQMQMRFSGRAGACEEAALPQNLMSLGFVFNYCFGKTYGPFSKRLLERTEMKSVGFGA